MNIVPTNVLLIMSLKIMSIIRKILRSSDDTFICHFEINITITNNIAYYNINITKTKSENCYRN